MKEVCVKKMNKHKLSNGEIIVLLIIIFSLLSAVSSVFITGRIISNQNKEIYNDPWSKECKKGEYFIIENNSNFCEPMRECLSDDDCNYLNMDKNPQRKGICKNNKCEVLCGRGIMASCVN